MADVIFTTGTSPKNEIYNVVINAFIAAGWTNVSSNPATDFDVLQSAGESGDKTLTIQIRPTSTTNTNSTLTTDYNICSYRLVEGYTPGAPGTAGTFARPTTEAWTSLYIVPSNSTVAGGTVMTYHMHVNKNRMIIVIESPNAVSLGPVTWYIGLPDATYCSEPGSRGLLVATSGYAKAGSSVHITNAPGELASDAASSTRATYAQLSPKNPNSAGNYALSEIMYGSSNEGYRGKLNGIYALPNTGVNNGDTINIGAKKFRVVINGVANNNSYPSVALAIQIA